MRDWRDFSTRGEFISHFETDVTGEHKIWILHQVTEETKSIKRMSSGAKRQIHVECDHANTSELTNGWVKVEGDGEVIYLLIFYRCLMMFKDVCGLLKSIFSACRLIKLSQFIETSIL